MGLILFFHFHCHVLQNSGDSLFRGIQIPLHIGVPIFVYISGYFEIRLTERSFARYVTKTGFYSLLILTITLFINYFSTPNYSFNAKNILNDIFFISRTDLWFVRAYFLLLILSPFINNVLHSLKNKQLILFITALSIGSTYFGLVSVDPHYALGRNLIGFIMLYAIGNFVKRNEIFFNKVKTRTYLFLYCACSVFLVALFMKIPAIQELLWKLSYGYYSLFMIPLSLFVFLGVKKVQFKSRTINYIASSAFAVYLIHENHNVNHYLYSVVSFLQEKLDIVTLYLALIGFALLIFSFCIIVDKATIKFQNYISSKLEAVFKKISFS